MFRKSLLQNIVKRVQFRKKEAGMTHLVHFQKLPTITGHILDALLIKSSKNPKTISTTKPFLCIRRFSSPPPTIPAIDWGNNVELCKVLPGLKEARKIRLNQLCLTRVGMKPAKKESHRQFEVINTENDEKLVFVKLHHSTKVEVFGIELFKFCEGQNPSGTALMRGALERNHKLHTVASRIYSSNGSPLAYIYDLEGVRRTAIIENGVRNKCLYQLQTLTPGGWTHDARIYNSVGDMRLGHFTKLDDYNRDELMIFLRIHSDLDVQSKCVFILASIYLMIYEYVR